MRHYLKQTKELYYLRQLSVIQHPVILRLDFLRESNWKYKSLQCDDFDIYDTMHDEYYNDVVNYDPSDIELTPTDIDRFDRNDIT